MGALSMDGLGIHLRRERIIMIMNKKEKRD